jgi:hypothetical protein
VPLYSPSPPHLLYQSLSLWSLLDVCQVRISNLVFAFLHSLQLKSPSTHLSSSRPSAPPACLDVPLGEGKTPKPNNLSPYLIKKLIVLLTNQKDYGTVHQVNQGRATSDDYVLPARQSRKAVIRDPGLGSNPFPVVCRPPSVWRVLGRGVAKNKKISTSNPSFKNHEFLKHSISIYAYTYIPVQNPPF